MGWNVLVYSAEWEDVWFGSVTRRSMIAAGQNDIAQHPHLAFIPGAVFLLTVMALNTIGDWARQRGDIRSAKMA